MAFALLACDVGGSVQGPIDTKVPRTGGAISFAGTTPNSVTVSWGASEDDFTSSRTLKYKLVRAPEASDIDTIAEVEGITSEPGLVADYTRGLTSREVSGLLPGTAYAFAVVVADSTGNKALYEPATMTTLDLSAPTPGMAIGFADVTATSVTLGWGKASDDATPADELQYKVVMAMDAADIDTLTEVDAITSEPGLVQDFTTALLTTTATGLSSSVRYSFAVVVRDAHGNEALYAPASVSTPDVTPPIVGSAITFSGITEQSLTVLWGPASDAVTALSGLRYKVVQASTAAAIDSLDEADAITSGPGLVKNYTAGIVSVAVAGLASSTNYAFAVVVKDAAGNRALYTPASAMTLDVSAPTPGDAIVTSSVTTTGLSLNWGAATDDVTPQSALKYKVVKATNPAAIDTLAEVALITTGSDLVQDFTAGSLSKVVTGLTSGTSYSFAVVVQDQQGNQAIYAPVTQSTLDDSAPVVGAAISFGSLAATSLMVTWGRATDNVSSQADLQYKLVQAASSSSIDTIAEVEAITSGPGLVMDFSADVTTRNVAGLMSSTTYTFAVLVKDVAGNKSLYAPATVSTLDVSAPTVGTVSFSNVTATQIDVSWSAASDDITPAASLEYKAVMGADAAAIDTLPEIDAITSGPGLLVDYTSNLTSTSATGLSSSTSYAFAVVVRDAAGNRAIYTPALQSTLDVTAPTVGNAISFSSVSDTSLSVDWGVASDDVSSAAQLQYKVVRAAQASDIDSLVEVDAVTSGPGLVQDFTANISTLPVTGLSSSTTYAFAVVVRDAAGNEALYAPDVVSTLDVTAPTPGTALSFTNIASTRVTVNWGTATDDITAAASLEYKLVTAATTGDIDTLMEADAVTGAGIAQDFTANLTSQVVTDLSANTSYAFAVVVRDAAGNKALYAPASVTTPWGSTVAAGFLGACSIKLDGGLYCWGFNAMGQVGDGTFSDRYTPVRVGSADDWNSIAMGQFHTCGIRAGELYCWGLNSNGQLGDGTTNIQSTPTRVGTDADWTSVTAGNNHSCGIRNGGELYCWGLNSVGQLGDGSTTDHGMPAQVGTAADWTSVGAGASHTCGVRSSGALYCWGDNSSGQLGDGSTDARNAPTQVGSDTDWSAVSLAWLHTCGLRSGAIYCWGDNGSGQVGTGMSGASEPNPVMVGSNTDWTFMSAGFLNSCGIRGGALYCWGNNAAGQVGDGTVTQRDAPVQIGTETDWSAVAQGYQTIGKRATGLYGWGYGANGGVGDGSMTSVSSPSAITLP